MRTTLKAINDALRAAGIDGELVRGASYFYFSGPAFFHCYSTSVMTTRLGSMTADQWVAEALSILQRSR